MIDSISTKVFLALAILSQLIQRILYFSIGEDISTQLHATVNFANGKGITVNEVLTNDLGKTISTSLSDWPVGYTLCLTPLYKLTSNIMWSAMILDVLFLSLFIFLIYKLLIESRVNEKATKIAMLFFALSATPFIYTTRTGVIAISFLLIGIINLLKISKKEQISVFHVAITSVLFILPILFRYAYLPFVATPFLFFAVKWMMSKEKQFSIAMLINLIVAVISVIAINYFQSSLVGARTYLSDSKEFGFYFSNLIYTKEFLLKGLYYVDPIIDFTNDNFVVKLFFKIIGLLFSTLVLIKLLITVFKNRFLKNGNFEIISIIAIALNIAMLIYLSLKYSNYHLTTYSWTFIQETRYFLPSIILLIVFLFKNYNENWIKNTLDGAIGFACVLLIVGILKMLITGPSEKLYSIHHQDFQIIKKELGTIKTPFIFSTEASEIALRNLIATESHTIYNGSVIKNLQENNFKTNSAVTLITKLTKAAYLEHQEIFLKNGSELLFENDQFILVKTNFPLG